MAKLTPDQQKALVAAEPKVFQPATGAWGRRGSTIIQLHDAQELTVRGALLAAWRNTAPKELLQKFDGE
jgi:hypothetical protein